VWGENEQQSNSQLEMRGASDVNVKNQL